MTTTPTHRLVITLPHGARASLAVDGELTTEARDRLVEWIRLLPATEDDAGRERTNEVAPCGERTTTARTAAVIVAMLHPDGPEMRP